MKQLYLYNPLFSFLLCAFMLCLAGCTNDDYDHITDDDNDDYMPVEVTFGGMETLFGPYGDEARNVQYNKIHETQDFDEERMLETLVMAEPDTLRPPMTRGTIVASNTTLRIVAYDQNNAAYKSTGVYNINSSGAVTAKSGEELILKSGKYYFHCFSPAQAVSISGNRVTVTLPTAGGTTDPAFYYAKTASAVQLTPDGNGKGNIAIPTLAPQYCKLTLDVSHYKGAAYTDAVLATTLYTGASLALPGGTVTSNTAAISTTIASSSPMIYTYPGATGSFKITVNGVTIVGAPKGNITTAVNSSGMTLAAGNAYKASVRLVSPNWIKILELPFKVARGILLYNSRTGKWMMAPDQGYYCPKQDGGYEILSADSEYGKTGDKVFSYFNWGVQAKTPNLPITSSGPYADAYGGTTENTHYGTKFGYNSTSATSASTPVSYYKNYNDPCYAALGGSWHLPTGGSPSSDMGILANASNTQHQFYEQPYNTIANLSSTDAREVKGFYFGTTSTPTSAAQDQYIFISSAGYRTEATDGQMSMVGSLGQYWTSTTDDNDVYKSSAYTLCVNGAAIYPDAGERRYMGSPVRCISY